MNAEQLAKVTKMIITLTIDQGDSIESAVSDLPENCRITFQEVSGQPKLWRGEYLISCSVAPELAAGDFVEDFCPHLREWLLLKDTHKAEYELVIAAGAPAPNPFLLKPHVVALLAALGASISIQYNK